MRKTILTRVRSAAIGVVIIGAALTLSSCGPYGGATIRADHQPYNEAVVGSLNQQLLLNLVRLKYRDNPYFVEIASITASHSVSGSAGFSAKIVNVNPMDSYSPSANTSVRVTPTVSYTPLRGEAFLKRLLTPLQLQTILTLVQSGWSIERVFGIAVEEINQLDNATPASGPTPSYAPQFRQFQRLTSLLRKVQRADAIQLGLDPAGKFPDLLLRLVPKPGVASQVSEIKQLLGISPQVNDIKLRSIVAELGSSTARIQTRSLMGVLFFLSQGIQSPPSHIEKGLVTITRNEDGSEFNWSDLTGGLMNIRYYEGPVPPANAFVYTRYRDTWFYVEDTDHSSKATFMLLNQLFNIKSGDPTRIAPALTLPVN